MAKKIDGHNIKIKDLVKRVRHISNRADFSLMLSKNFFFRDIEKVETANVDYQMGDRIVLNNLVGQPQYRKIINFYDQLSSSINQNKGGATLIGQARLYSLNPKRFFL